VVHENTQGIYGCNQDIKTQVKFTSIDKKWPFNVPITQMNMLKDDLYKLELYSSLYVTYFCTIRGLLLGIWPHRFITLMPAPRALAGGFIIHFVFRWAYFGQCRRNAPRSFGIMYVRGMNPNSLLLCLPICLCRFFQHESFRPIRNEPGK